MIYYEYFRDRLSQQIMWFQNDITYGCHVHRGVEFILAADDGCTVYCAHKEYHLRQGDIVFVHSWQEHSVEDKGNNICFFIPVRYLDHYFTQTKGRAPEGCYINAERAKDLYELIIQAKICEGCKNETLMHGYANLVLGKLIEIIRFVPVKFERSSDFDLIGDICSYINEHFREEITLEVLEKKFFYNQHMISRVFCEKLQCSLKEYVNNIRLEHFVNDYRQDVSVESQAFECGFNSRQTFYRAFKKKYGVSPNRYFIS